MSIIKEEIKRGVTDIETKALRIISKEGASRYPTCFVLFNSIFISDDNNKSGKLNVPYRIKPGDTVMWYKTTDLKSIFKNALQDLIENVPLFTITEKEEYKNIKNIYNSGKSYYIYKNNYLYISNSISNTQLYHKINNINTTDKILIIIPISETLDLILCENKAISINTTTHLESIRLTKNGDSKFTSSSKVGDKLLISTSDDGIYIITNFSQEEGTFSYSKIEYKEWTVTVPPEGEGEPSTIFANNNFPETNNITYIYPTSQNTIEAGNSLTHLSININSYISDEQYEIPESILDLSSSSPKSFYNNDKYFLFSEGSFYISGTSEKIEVDSRIYSAYSNENTILAAGDKCLFIINSASPTNKVKLNEKNGINDIITSITLDENNDILLCCENENLLINEDNEKNKKIIFYPMHFIFKTDADLEEYPIQERILNIKDILISFISDSIYNSNLATCNGKSTTFLLLYSSKENNKSWFGCIGNDNRQETYLRDFSNAFDIGINI